MGFFSPFLQALSRTRQPNDRIEDDQTGERQSGSPSSDPSQAGRSAILGSVASNQGTNLADRTASRVNPLEEQISSDRNEYNRLVAPPPPMTISQRIRSAISAAAGAGRFTGPAAEQYASSQATLRDRAAARKQQEIENLGGRIDANARALSGQQEAEARLQEQEQLRARLNEENIAARERNVDVQQAGATGRTQLTQAGATGRTGMEIASREGMQTQRLEQQYKEFQNTDQYRRWKAQLDNSTRLHIAQLAQSKAPAALMQTAVFADGGIKSLNDAETAMAKLEQAGVFGQSWAQNKVEDWIFGKGAVDPSLPPDVRKTIGELRTSLNLAASAMTRAHTQRGSKEVYDDLKTRLGPGQDWSALRGAISESQDMLGNYVQAASDANIMRIRSGANPPTPNAPAAPTLSDRTANPNEIVIDVTRRRGRP